MTSDKSDTVGAYNALVLLVNNPLYHHEGCNIVKFKNDKYPCNCLFNKNHNEQCVFIKQFNFVEKKKLNCIFSGGFIHQWASTHDTVCSCIK